MKTNALPLYGSYNLVMNELSPRQVTLEDSFWTPRQIINAEKSIFHQWQMLENTGCIDNFRIAAGIKEGSREGWFFADSDAYKWLEAAAGIYSLWPSKNLKDLIDDFIILIRESQMKDGYLFTYNQINFPSSRWENLMIEHELYCHGHLIESCVSHFDSFGDKSVLKMACHAADLLVDVFLDAAPDKTSGHEEIEIALIRLYKVTGDDQYLELAHRFLERRGKTPFFAMQIFIQNLRVNRRLRLVQMKKENSMVDMHHPLSQGLTSYNYAKINTAIKFRWLLSGLSGKFFQMHAPIREQTVPVGHAVRFAYLETATAMFYRQNLDPTLLPALKQAWTRMVTRRMYITGGIGSLPFIEGFGRDYELDPEIAYAETCSSLGSLYWNWEMGLITKEACYSDLFEWQLYNAAAVGMGMEGTSYSYNNPLASHGGLSRMPWFKVACCPSNLSRTWASLGKYIFSHVGRDLWIHQYIGCQAEINLGTAVKINLRSSFPWEGKACLNINPQTTAEFTIHLRIPSWAKSYALRINGQQVSVNPRSPTEDNEPPASGYDPHHSWFATIHRVWSPGDVLELEFEMDVKIRRVSSRVKGQDNKVALTRGPIVFCLESIDNPGLDIFRARVNLLCIIDRPDCVTYLPSLLGGTETLCCTTIDEKILNFIPYFLWANRGKSQMTVWVNS